MLSIGKTRKHRIVDSRAYSGDSVFQRKIRTYNSYGALQTFSQYWKLLQSPCQRVKPLLILVRALLGIVFPRGNRPLGCGRGAGILLTGLFNVGIS